MLSILVSVALRRRIVGHSAVASHSGQAYFATRISFGHMQHLGA
jgi:hypothetical protein